MKRLKAILHFLISPFMVGVFLTLFFSWIAMEYYVRHKDLTSQSFLMDQIDILHQRSIDLRMRLRGEIKRDSKIAILAIDEEALSQLGHWPWSRSVISETIEKLFSYNPKVLAFDIIFAEEDKKSSVPSLLQIKKMGNIDHQTQPTLNKIIDEEIDRSNTDEILAKTIAKYSSKLVMATYMDSAADTDVRKAYKDLCFNQLFARSEENQYFSKETPLVSSLDDNENALPFQWVDILNVHYDSLELLAIKKWYALDSENKNKYSELRQLLTRVNLPTSEKTSLILTQFWIKKQLSKLKKQVERINPKFSNAAEFETFMLDVDNVLSPNDRVSLEKYALHTKAEYCQRFLSENDELLPKFKESWPMIQKDSPEAASHTFEEEIDSLKTTTLYNTIERGEKWWVNIQSLAEKTSYTGNLNAVQDTDGTIRQSQLFARAGNFLVPSIAFQAYLVGNKYTASVVIKEDPFNNPPQFKQVQHVDIFDQDGKKVALIPTTPDGKLPINYAGEDKQFPYLSVGELLSPQTTALISERIFDAKTKTWKVITKKVDKADFIRDRFFIFGATAVGIYDLRVTPFAENYPGVETHANALDNFLRKDFLRTLASEEVYMPIFILILGILLSFAISKFGALAGLFIAALTFALLGWVDKNYFFGQGIVVTVVFPLGLTGMLYLALTFYKYFTEERQKKELRGTFQKYVSPSIVNELLKDPSNLELGGKKQVMTVFFSDVRGFTTISEKLDPRALSSLLNSYLTPMTEIVFKNRGTLDKYMGDAVMAFFGAPLTYPDHAACAVRCALEQIEKLMKLQIAYREQGLPSIDIGIGINTGEMSVGNMGSQTVRSYTVMGDAVNLASRLEAINKQYGTRLIISEFTYEALQGKFQCREIDWVQVKGKVQPVKIFEVLSEKPLEKKLETMLEHFRQGIVCYHQKQFENALTQFTLALDIKPDDPVSLVYIERCQDYLKNPPSEDWDGVFVMTSK